MWIKDMLITAAVLNVGYMNVMNEQILISFK